MMQDSVIRREILFIDDVHHDGCQCVLEVVGILVAETHGQGSLRISIDQADFLSLHCKPDSKIRCHSGFSASTFLICYSYNNCHLAFLLFASFLIFFAGALSPSLPGVSQ